MLLTLGYSYSERNILTDTWTVLNVLSLTYTFTGRPIIDHCVSTRIPLDRSLVSAVP